MKGNYIYLYNIGTNFMFRLTHSGTTLMFFVFEHFNVYLLSKQNHERTTFFDKFLLKTRKKENMRREQIDPIER